jgi:hypothetical protein
MGCGGRERNGEGSGGGGVRGDGVRGRGGGEGKWSNESK